MPCPHLTDGNCSVATLLAKQSIPTNSQSCKACKEQPNPQTENLVTIGLARITLQKLGQPYQHLYPENIQERLKEVEELQRDISIDLAKDGIGNILVKNNAWANPEDGCACKDYISAMNRWTDAKCLENKDKLTRWFYNSIRKKFPEVTQEQVELGIFRAIHEYQTRDAVGIKHWPFVWTYWAGGAVGDELKYSIRSVLHHHPNARILVVGDQPDWYVGEMIHCPRIKRQEFHAFRDCYHKLLTAANQLEQYVWMMDDIYWIKPFTVQEATVPKYVRHVSQERFKKWKPKNAWGKTRLHAYRWLFTNNRPTYDFASHLPQPIISESFLQMEKDLNLMTGQYRNWECLYLNSNLSGIAEDWGRRYLRVASKHKIIKTPHKVLNHTDSQYKGAVETFLQEQFNKPSSVEK